MYKFYVVFNDSEEYVGQNIIDFKTKRSQTNIFKTFLSQLNKDGEKEGTQLYRIEDFSAGGVSFHCSNEEAKYFSHDLVIEKVKLNIRDEFIEIPQSKVVYNISKIDITSNMSRSKIGLEFVDLDINTDQQIAGTVNEILREKDFSGTFELFLDND